MLKLKKSTFEAAGELESWRAFKLEISSKSFSFSQKIAKSYKFNRFLRPTHQILCKFYSTVSLMRIGWEDVIRRK
jgi:hypothetical protein